MEPAYRAHADKGADDKGLTQMPPLRHVVPSEVSHQLPLQEGAGLCYTYQPHGGVSAATGHADSTMHLHTGK